MCPDTHTHTQTNQATTEICRVRLRVEAWRGDWGVQGAFPAHQSGLAVHLCSRVVWPWGWAWLEREGLCTPSANDRAQCTQYKSLWPINTTSTRTKSIHIHIYFYTHTKILIDCIHHQVISLFNYTHHLSLTHTHGRNLRLGVERRQGSVVVPYRAYQTAASMMECLSLQPSFLFSITQYLWNLSPSF